MKKVFAALFFVFIAGYFLIDYMAGRYLEKYLDELDLEALLSEICSGDVVCLDAIEQHYNACSQGISHVDAEQYFSVLDEALACINERSGVDIEALIDE